MLSINYVPSNMLWRAYLVGYEVVGLFPPLTDNLAVELYRMLDAVPFAGSPYLCSVMIASDEEAYLTFATMNFSEAAQFNQYWKWIREIKDCGNDFADVSNTPLQLLRQVFHHETKRISIQQIGQLRHTMQAINVLKISDSGEPCARDGRYGYGQVILDGQLHHFEVDGCPKSSEEESWKNEHIRFFRSFYDIATDCLDDDFSKQQIEKLNTWFYGFHRPD